MRFVDKPLFTDEYSDPASFSPEPGATYIFGVTHEQRSEFALELERRTRDVRFVELREAERFVIETEIEEFSRISLRRRSVVENFVRSLGDGPVYLDITGLGHSTWHLSRKSVSRSVGQCESSTLSRILVRETARLDLVKSMT